MGSVLAFGVVAPSWNENLGHECWKPAVYTTPRMCTATGYARPHVLFSDGVYYRVVLELRVDDRRKMKKRQAGGHQILIDRRRGSRKAAMRSFLLGAKPRRKLRAAIWARLCSKKPN